MTSPNEKTVTIDVSKLLRDQDGNLHAEPFDSFVTGEGYTSTESMVIFRVYSAYHQPPEQGREIPAAAARQFVTTADRARALAHALLASADEIDGVGQRNQ